MFPEIDKREIGQRLKNILREKELTVKDVQEYLSLSCVQTVYRWMEGINIPCVDHLYALSVLMDISIDYLVTGEQRQEKGSGRETRRNLFLRGDFIVYGSVSPADDGAGSEWCKVCLFLQREKDTYEPERALRYLEGFCAA